MVGSGFSAESHLDDRGSVLHGAAVHVAGIELGDVPVHPGAHPNEGGGGASLGVLDHLPVVLRGRDVRVKTGEEDGDQLVVLVGILKDLVGTGGDNKVPIQSGE